MKTYLRILQFAKPYSRFVPLYTIYTILGIIFGLFNFTLLIPLLDVLFGKVGQEQVMAMVANKPEFALNFKFFQDFFYYHFGQIILDAGRQGALLFVCIIIVASVFLANLFRYLAFRIIGELRAHVVRNMRQSVYKRVTELHMGYFSNERKGDLMTRMTVDIQEVESSVVSTLTVVIREPISIIAFFVLLFNMSVELTLFSLILLPLSGGIIAGISKRLKRKAQQGQSSLSFILTIIDETLSGMRVIKAFNAEPFILGKFHDQNNRYANIQRSIAHKRDLASPLSEFLGVTVVAGLLLYGGTLVLNQQSELSASEFITYIILFSQVLVPAKAMSSAFSNIQRGLVSGDRVLQVIDTEPQIVNKPDAKVLPAFQHEIEFRDVSFAYGKKPVLQDINFKIQKGQTIALVGQSGGGKSTLADLVPRFYDPTEGAVLIDGLDIRDYTMESVRDQIGVVTQESILFNDTIFNNIAFNKTDATEEEVIAAAKIANAHEFIVHTEEGYQTMIGDRGGKLSGGQRQRLSIARAILQNPPILILDEATSALDTESEKLVQEALTNLMRNRTSIVIAHRLSTIQHADEILVLQKGKVVERGTHDQLLTDSGLYAKLTQMQLVQ
ncbi:ABC transporter ATP-binding protein [Pontibacter sp. BT310]|uniref:ABC transporter ATP-binding protein/permease n=1 Tax=Pontibacter populi TaxID=890055 RepID=A0ABS6XGJ1_9BACT|nr:MULTISPECIES: ABC transporter ATP-binding protein [Pontibacter]MBJ6119825.1 ABC transporter ATP-binding protein [Pontibacter sp. BT310]MBR0572254.1 ABC transporter ATP-binding protein [Microvirga sp. STS03]MBW3366678.1 ABC transporter ATP-binding protein/permease [Pontibacter populi]